MSERSGKRRKIYVDHPKGGSKTCHIYGPGHSSYECKVLGDFGYNYIRIITSKDRGHNPVPKNKLNMHQEDNYIVNSAMDEILLHENQMVSSEKEAPENIECDFYDNEIYQVENMSLEDTKYFFNDVSVNFNANRKYLWD